MESNIFFYNTLSISLSPSLPLSFSLSSVDLNAADTGVQLKPSTPATDRKPASQASSSGSKGCCS